MNSEEVIIHKHLPKGTEENNIRSQFASSDSNSGPPGYKPKC